MKKIKLFCFPYAGGSAVIYNNWRNWLTTEIELRPVELAGRGKRVKEELYKDLPSAVEDVFDVIKDEIKNCDYAFFGHSMGGLIAYELAQKIQERNILQPVHIFFSGRGAPHIKREDDKIFHRMNDETFKKEIIELGGTPVEFFEYPELLELFIPLLKNDFKITETALVNNEIVPLDCNISVFLGKSDDLSAEECHAWNAQTNGLCAVYYFKGGHFFLHHEAKNVVEIINHTLRENLFVSTNNLAILD